jgi:hypothetical protein
MQDVLVGLIAFAALGVIAWRVVRANRATSAETPSCPSCPGYDPKLHGKARSHRARS